jgi:hypothetical protein
MNEFERDLSAHVDGLTPPVPPPYDGVTARRSRRRTRRALVATVGAAAAVVAIVGGASALRTDDPAEEQPVTTPDTSPPTDGIVDVSPEWDEEGAPPILLQLDGGQAVVEPWGYCYGNSCIDGMPQPPFEDVGDRAEVPFTFPLEGWTFEASFSPAGESRCERTINVPVEKHGDFTFAVPTAGPPGAYDVNVFGSGPGGDVITTFAWTTTETGFLPEPSGYAGIIASNDELDSYGVEVGLEALADSPRDASVTITVTAANGRSTTIGPIAQSERCADDGTVSFIGDQADGKRAAALGPAPFDYRLEVTLDGATYVGSAVWPRDEKQDLAPYTTLTFDPPLPAYAG